MSKTRSLLSKYFLICTAVVLLGAILISGVLLLVSSHYISDGNKRDLLDTLDETAHNSQNVMFEYQDRWDSQVKSVLYEESIKNGCYVFIFNSVGILELEPNYPELSNNNIQDLFRESIKDSISAYGYYEFEEHPQYLNGKYHIAATSFSYNGTLYYLAALRKHGFILSEKQLASLVICYAVFAAILYFAVYKMARRASDPIKDITKISEQIIRGNYDDKMPVSSIRELGELSEAINRMMAAVEQNDNVRNAFVSNVSHELRTPLTSISGFVDGIIDGTIPRESQETYLKIISSEVKRLTRLTRLMLALSRLDSGASRPTIIKISVIEMIVDILDTFENRINEKDINILGLDVGKKIIYADHDMIHQVIYNLVENAIKFTPKGGYIEFGFNSDSDYTYVSVKNSGNGLTPEECQRVFDRFYKTDASRANDAMGVGLGLNIVRSIIKLHKGVIDVDSVVGEYTQFTFAIPNFKEK